MSWDSRVDDLSPDAAPPWLAPLVDSPGAIKKAYRRTGPVLAALAEASRRANSETSKISGAAGTSVTSKISGASEASEASGDSGDSEAAVGSHRDAAVLVLFSGPTDGAAGTLPSDADLLVTVRAATLRHHAGQAAFPGGAADPGDHGPVHTALREAAEETGIEAHRLHPLAALEKMYIPPSGFHVVPVLAYSADPGPVAVVDEAETAVVARVPVRAFVNPDNRIMVYRSENTRRSAGPAFLLNEMLVWGFTGQVISAMLDVAGWTQPWDTDNVVELNAAMALLEAQDSYGEAQR